MGGSYEYVGRAWPCVGLPIGTSYCPYPTSPDLPFWSGPCSASGVYFYIHLIVACVRGLWKMYTAARGLTRTPQLHTSFTGSGLKLTTFRFLWFGYVFTLVPCPTLSNPPCFRPSGRDPLFWLTSEPFPPLVSRWSKTRGGGKGSRRANYSGIFPRWSKTRRGKKVQGRGKRFGYPLISGWKF